MRALVVIFGFACLVPIAAVAQELPADCPTKPPGADDARALAGNWFIKAEGLYKQERYDDALGAFQCSLSMAEHPNTYFNAAQTAVTTGNRRLALELAQNCLKLSPAEPLKSKAEELVDQLEKEVPDEPPPPVVAEEEPIEEPLEGPVEPVPPPAEEEPEVDEPDGEGANLALPGYVLLGVGGATLVVGAILQGLTGAAQTDSEETDDYQVFKDKKDSGEKMQKGAIACFVIGGVVAATGLVLVIADGSGEEQGGEVAFVPGPGGFLIEGSF